MKTIEEGKFNFIPAELLTDELIEAQVQRLLADEEEYPIRDVLGVMDLADKVRSKVLVPTTVYEISGDDTSGVAGLLMPSGEFIAAAKKVAGRRQRYWEHEETFRYEQTPNTNPVKGNDGVFRVVGNSWTAGEVVWDGRVTGSIDPVAEDGDRQGPVSRRLRGGSLTGDWPENNGELWKAIGRGTSMR